LAVAAFILSSVTDVALPSYWLLVGDAFELALWLLPGGAVVVVAGADVSVGVVVVDARGYE